MLKEEGDALHPGENVAARTTLPLRLQAQWSNGVRFCLDQRIFGGMLRVFLSSGKESIRCVWNRGTLISTQNQGKEYLVDRSLSLSSPLSHPSE
jgi:hypothetical protein